MSITKKALSKLKSDGHRLTLARKVILDIIYKSSTPLAALEIGERLSESGIIKNKTTIYRELAFLQKEKLIRAVDIGLERTAYESAKEDHHHHLICKSCRKVENINLKNAEDALKKEARKIIGKKKFVNIEHSLELFGTCADCL